jgi:hypothetical protein
VGLCVCNDEKDREEWTPRCWIVCVTGYVGRRIVCVTEKKREREKERETRMKFVYIIVS